MTVAAAMLVKDEVDVILPVVMHLLEQGIDEVVVADNLSTDGTFETLCGLRDAGLPVTVSRDNTVGYWQSMKTTSLAQHARRLGHEWVIPCDADEWWYSNHGTLAEQLARYGGVDVVAAELYDHLPTRRDNPKQPDPFRRIGWRFREPLPLAKVACRLRPDLTVGAGNHTASFLGDAKWSSEPGLLIRHFSWRGEEQYVRKMLNGYRAYAQTTLPEDVGLHWKLFGDPDDPENPGWEERARGHFREWFWSDDPASDDRLIYDPAPRDLILK